MRIRRAAGPALVIGLLIALTVTPGLAEPARAAEYTLESRATYELRPADHEVRVSVELTFTNTTPDPEGQFSVFDELRLAIHDAATAVTASDPDGELEVDVAEEDGVRVATIALRAPLRFEESVEVEMQYTLRDGGAPQVRIGPSLVVFPAWGFGTASQVRVEVPDGYEVRVDGDMLTETEAGVLTSGPIEDPAAWLALVIAVGPPEFTTLDATVPLEGGTVDLLVRAFADDPEWAEATRDLVVDALPLVEQEVGLPYPVRGQLVLVESVPADSSGFGEPTTRRAEIEVAYDQPSFTILHQLVHLWLDPLVEARWIAEGMASEIAARVAGRLDVDLPFDPAAEAQRRADDAFPLDAWGPGSDAAAQAYAHAAAWDLVATIRDTIGDEAMGAILARTAASVGPYDDATVDAPPEAGEAPRAPLTSRTLLDQVAVVAGTDMADLFSTDVLTDEDIALLPDRSAARSAFEALDTAADGWGTPDPVRNAMREWRFDQASSLIDEARDWLVERDALLADMERAGLSRPERLPQAYRSYGGGVEADTELAAERSVVDAYAGAADRINAPRSLLARLGLVGGSDPATELGLAHGRFADGDLRGALDSIDHATRLLESAETTGIVRVVSLALVLIGLAAVALAVFRRRASYTASR